MASRPFEGGASALPDLAAMFAVIPSLPRPLLARLTARLIDRMDEIDGDPDLEDDDPDSSVEDDPRGLVPTCQFGARQRVVPRVSV